MRCFTPLIIASLAIAVLPSTVSAFDAGQAEELRQVFSDGLAGETVDAEALDDLIARAAETGRVPLTFYDGTLDPIDGPVTLNPPSERRFVCTTDVKTDPPTPPSGTLQDSEERIEITNLADGRRRVVFETVDAQATVGFKIVSDGRTANVEEFSMSEQGETQRFAMRDDGSMEDAASGIVLEADSADVQAVTGMADLVAKANPFWFASDATLNVGEGYLGDELLRGMMDGIGQIIGVSNDDDVAVEMTFFRYVLTGTTEINGTPHYVFQGALRMDIDSRKLGPTLPVAADFVQAFDAETALQSLYTSRMTLNFGGKPFRVNQTQTCESE